MRREKVDSAAVLRGLSEVFRSKGYEGASLGELAEATGLKKASLYHRFPGGKNEMAEAVLNHIDGWVVDNVFRALGDEQVSPQMRLKNGIAEINKLYAEGSGTCIFRALSMEAGLELFDEQIKNGMLDWIEAFRKLGVAFGLVPDAAHELAIQTLVEIQGGLVVAKGMGDTRIFELTLRKIEKHYIK